MSKTCRIETNKKRERMSQRDAVKRSRLKAIVMNRSLPIEDRFSATLKLAAMPRNGAKVRIRNRCAVTGRARAVYRKFKLCRNMLREMGTRGMIPGLVKSSW